MSKEIEEEIIKDFCVACATDLQLYKLIDTYDRFDADARSIISAELTRRWLVKKGHIIEHERKDCRLCKGKYKGPKPR